LVKYRLVKELVIALINSHCYIFFKPPYRF